MPEIGRPNVHDHADNPGGGTIAHSATTSQSATDHHTAAILESVLTTRGDMIRRGASAPERVALGTSTEVMGSDGTDAAWEAAAAGGALTRLGSVTTEATTTSTSDVDLLTISGLSIAAGVPILTYCAVRKTTGAANIARGGLKLNTTQVRVAGTWSSTTDQVEDGIVTQIVITGDTDYQGAFTFLGNSEQGAISNHFEATAAVPIATVTDIIFLGKVNDGAITMGVKHFHAYSFSVS